MTNNFGQNDLVDVGLHGKVYPVVLEGKHVAVKKVVSFRRQRFFLHMYVAQLQYYAILQLLLTAMKFFTFMCYYY